MRSTGTFIACFAIIPALVAGCVFELNPKFDPEDSATTGDSASSSDHSGTTSTTTAPSTSEATTAETSGQPTTTASPATSDTTTDPTVGVTDATTDATTDGTTGDPEPICGDGTREGGEECDDGANIDKDGCSATCTYEEPTGVVLGEAQPAQSFGPGGMGLLSKPTCPAGNVMTAFHGYTTPMYNHITKVKASCASIMLNGEYQVVTGLGAQVAEYLGCCNAGNLPWEQICPAGALVTGFSGTSEAFGVSSFAVHCTYFAAEPTDSGYKLIQKETVILGPNGKQADQPYDLQCGEYGVIDALISEQVENAAILKVTVKCRNLELVF